MEVLNLGRTAIWRTRAGYLMGGLDFALHDESRPGKPKQYEADVEAQVTALACSDPPPGAQRWTVVVSDSPRDISELNLSIHAKDCAVIAVSG